tara:strand:- start:7056 stop:7361 length:306 start_codon:yes stop_codon:yes gene_type:complete
MVKIKQKYRDRKEWSRNRRVAGKAKSVVYMGGKCNHCGWLYEVLDVFEFHHIDPSKKDFAIGKFLNCSWEKIKKELDKCVMLCANCHRIEHDRLKRLESST